MKHVRIVRAAKRDLDRARAYHEKKRPGLGEALLREFQRTARYIAENPEAGTQVRPEIRRALLNRFRYSVLYEVTATEVVVLAVMHHRQNPERWLRRLGK